MTIRSKLSVNSSRNIVDKSRVTLVNQLYTNIKKKKKRENNLQSIRHTRDNSLTHYTIKSLIPMFEDKLIGANITISQRRISLLFERRQKREKKH